MKNGKCRDTEKCSEYYHPKLCYSIKKGEECTKERCKALHLWAKGKPKVLPPPAQDQDQATPPVQQLPPQTTPHSYAQVAVLQPTQTQTPQTVGFLSNPPHLSPPDPIQELRKMLEALTQKVELISQRVPQTQFVRI